GLLAVLVYGNVGQRHEVLAVARTVDPGQVISAEDLTVVRVAADPDVRTLAASARSSIVGQRAAVRLLPGSLLSPDAVTKGDVIGPGFSVIGAIVKPGQYPPGLRDDRGGRLHRWHERHGHLAGGARRCRDPTRRGWLAKPVVADRAAMTAIGLVSPKHAPGTTTAAVALALAAGDGALVVEADAAGGDIAARAGLPLEPGLLTMAAAGRHGGSAASLRPQCLPSGVDAVVAPTSPDQAAAALGAIADRLVSATRHRDVVCVDCGRWSPVTAVPVVLA